MSRDILIERLAAEYVADQYRTALLRTAGEVRHVKDTGNVKRRHLKQHDYRPKDLKLLTRLLWHISVALGHVSSSVHQLIRVKSLDISPDGFLGGTGYDKSIVDIRQDLYTTLEALSGLQDTLYDEVRAPHWQPQIEELPDDDKEDVEEMIEDVDSIRKDPEAYGDSQYEEQVEDEKGDEEDHKVSEFDPDPVKPEDE